MFFVDLYFPEFDLFFAVDGVELKKVLEVAGYNTVLTSPDLPSGTDRIAKANQELQKEFVCHYLLGKAKPKGIIGKRNISMSRS